MRGKLHLDSYAALRSTGLPRESRMILAATSRSQERRRTCYYKANKPLVIYVTRSRCRIVEKAGSRSVAWCTSRVDERLLVVGPQNRGRDEQRRVARERIREG